VNAITDASMQRIAWVDSYTNYLQWNVYSSQRSGTRTLTAGQYYYIKVIYKEGSGGDHAEVAWKKPGDPSPNSMSNNDASYIIPQNYLTQITNLPTTFCAGDGATYEVWTGVNGTSVSNLTSLGAYPNNPNLRYDGISEPIASDRIYNFEAFEYFGDNFGGVVRAIVCVPTTGNYQFWLASDDNGQLAYYATQLRGPGAVTAADLNTMSATIGGISDAAMTVLARVPNWTDSRAWSWYLPSNGYPAPNGQQSNVIALNSGYYYFKAIYKESSGGDNLAVAWKKPSNTFSIPADYSGAAIIPQSNLYYIRGLPNPPNTPTPTITRTPTRTFTPGPPTNTPTRTRTFTPGPPTNTPGPATPTRTRTATPTRTNTPPVVPPTNTVPPSNTPNVPSPTPPIPCPWTYPQSQTYCDGPWLKPGAPTPPP
jgi:hypothetical protein